MKVSLFALASMLQLVHVAASSMVAPADYPRFLQEKEQLLHELEEWKHSEAGQYAQKHGFFIPKAKKLESTAQATKPKRMTEDEQLRRFFLTKLSIEKVQAANPDATFSTDTPFTLMTEQEFATFVGQSYQRSEDAAALFEGAPFASMMNSTLSTMEEAADLVADASKDWTTSGCMAPVKNQGKCGSCWAFAAIGALETANCLKGNGMTLLSEQQVTSCDQTSYGCEGSFPSNALEYIQKNNGVCKSADYPYTSGKSGKAGECASTCTKETIAIHQVVNIPASEAGLTQALNQQPVAVGVAAGNNTWKQYKDGIVSTCTSSSLDHAVLAVGYGSDANTPFFKIKNSWGTSWGEAGFIRLKRGVAGAGTCGVIGPKSVYPQL